MGLSDYLDKKYGQPKKAKKVKITAVAKIAKNSANITKNSDRLKPPVQQQTVYRDSSGRKIDIHEKLRQDRETLLKKQLEQQHLFSQTNQGESQKLESDELQQKLHKVKNLKTTVYADDEDLNKELRSKMLSDDPLLQISSTLRPDVVAKKSDISVSVTGRRLYDGIPPVNRFNIKPGHRWDGVDRSNGFEQKWFDKQYAS